jgi:phage terminase small subunit
MRGTARADRAREPGPEPPAGEIKRPKFLTHRAKELWDEYAPALIEMQTLTVVDVPNFAAWCVLNAEFEDKKTGIKAAKISQMRLLAASLGMDASARAKLGTGGKKKKKDPADEFFKKNG